MDYYNKQVPLTGSAMAAQDAAPVRTVRDHIRVLADELAAAHTNMDELRMLLASVSETAPPQRETTTNGLAPAVPTRCETTGRLMEALHSVRALTAAIQDTVRRLNV